MPIFGVVLLLLIHIRMICHDHPHHPRKQTKTCTNNQHEERGSRVGDSVGM